MLVGLKKRTDKAPSRFSTNVKRPATSTAAYNKMWFSIMVFKIMRLFKTSSYKAGSYIKCVVKCVHII